ncbi:PREDICTED: uncharacterized protein LOC105456301 [Wasmannia auropunctata]|uniref:uncharacterized protein LOC105456301 n=1 Tax=Wasmannia auropunctata TaxID=64793 RepID=UPI0005EE5EEA|nr:PREDICTED: uncharacterized protein LOC105456301 [Wasmannia auropunctata]
MNILPRILTFLSHKKLRVTHALNESLRLRQKLLASRAVPNRMISYGNFNINRKNSITCDNFLLPRRNISNGNGIITRFKREKSTQSGKKDDSKPHRERVEDHRQSAEEPREWRSDGYQIPAENYQKTCSDSLNHHQSIESNSPIHSNKPVSYSNRQACSESSKHESRKSTRATRITSKKWICRKPATESKIYHKCKPKSRTYPDGREETIGFPSSQDYCEDKSRQAASHPSTRLRPESEPLPSKNVTSCKKVTCPEEREAKKKKEYPASDMYEYRRKPDPPPPRQPHWSENLPSYCDPSLKKTTTTRSSPVKASPMIFIPDKGSRKSRARDTASSLQNIHKASKASDGGSPNEKECGRTDTKKAPQKLDESRKCTSRCTISFEDRCATSLTIPPPTVNRTMDSRSKQFPTFTKDGRCAEKAKKKSVCTTDFVSDCSPNMASFKYRLSKCPPIKEMWSIGVKREPPVDVSVRQDAFNCKKSKRPDSRPETASARRRLGTRLKSRAPATSNGWTRQKYKVRLKIFRKENTLDPCLPQIVELRQPRGEKTRPRQSKFAADEGEHFSQSESSHCRPSKLTTETESITETKSYPTKMNESRVIRDQHKGKQLCKKSR